MANKCAFGRENRQMIKSIQQEFYDFREEIRGEFKSLKQTNIKLYNHLSSRLPPWAIAVGGLGTAIIGALIGAVVKSVV